MRGGGSRPEKLLIQRQGKDEVVSSAASSLGGHFRAAILYRDVAYIDAYL